MPKKISRPKAKAKWSKPSASKAKSAMTSPLGAGVWPAAGFNTFTASTTPKNMENFMNKSQSQFDNLTKDQGAWVKDTMEAMMKSGKVTAERMQEMMNFCTQMAQESSEKQAQMMKSMMQCKTMSDWTEFQSKCAQNSFEDMMQAMTKFTEMTIKVTSEAMEPINDQMTKAMKKASDTMAA
jgi:phasin family protein